MNFFILSFRKLSLKLILTNKCIYMFVYWANFLLSNVDYRNYNY